MHEPEDVKRLSRWKSMVGVPHDDVVAIDRLG